MRAVTARSHQAAFSPPWCSPLSFSRAPFYGARSHSPFKAQLGRLGLTDPAATPQLSVLCAPLQFRPDLSERPAVDTSSRWVRLSQRGPLSRVHRNEQIEAQEDEAQRAGVIQFNDSKAVAVGLEEAMHPSNRWKTYFLYL